MRAASACVNVSTTGLIAGRWVGTRAEEGKKWSWDSTQRIEMKASRVAGRTEPSKVSDSKK